MSEVLIIGGNSRLGLAFRSRPDFLGCHVTRAPDGSSNNLVKSSYFDLMAADFDGFTRVINLVGANLSDPRTLQSINVDLVEHLAEQARAAGVKSFYNISSFSIFGDAQQIDEGTTLQPINQYGRSKLQAELMLQQKATQSFGVTAVRLPMLYGDGPSKLNLLLNFWAKIRRLPVPVLNSQRSMLHYELAADALIGLDESSGFNVVALADPRPFEFRPVAEIMSKVAGRKVDTIAIWNFLMSPLELIRPELYKSLYHSSYLHERSNRLVNSDFKSRLYQDIRKMTEEIYAKK